MSNFSLRLEAFAGSDISDCAREACRLADRLGVVVLFDFNGVECMACPGDEPAFLANAYHVELNRPERSIGSVRLGKFARGGRPQLAATQVSGVE